MSLTFYFPPDSTYCTIFLLTFPSEHNPILYELCLCLSIQIDHGLVSLKAFYKFTDFWQVYHSFKRDNNVRPVNLSTKFVVKPGSASKLRRILYAELMEK